MTELVSKLVMDEPVLKTAVEQFPNEPSVEEVLAAADFSVEAQAQAVADNGTAFPYIWDKMQSNDENITAMLSQCDEFFTRSGSTNGVQQSAVQEWARGIGRYPRIFQACFYTLQYLGLPESEAIASHPFFNVVGSNISDNKIKKLNSPIWTPEKGWEGDVVSGSHYIDIYPNYWPNYGGGNSFLGWYRYVSKLATGLHREGFYNNSAERITVLSGDIYFERHRFTLAQELGGCWANAGGEDEDYNPSNDYFAGKFYNQGDYITPKSSHNSSASCSCGSTNRKYYLHAYGSTEPPTQFSDHASSQLCFPRGLRKDAAAIYAALNDELQSNFGR